jgi:hypothetical protein
MFPIPSRITAELFSARQGASFQKESLGQYEDDKDRRK